MIAARSLVALSAVGLTLAAGIAGHAQQATPAPPKPDTLLKVDVVLSRFQGDKKTGSLPFVMWINLSPTVGNGQIRVGVDVPIGNKTTTSAETTGMTTNPDARTRSTTTSGSATTTEYRYVGTQIDCGVSTLADGRYSVRLGIQDSSIFTDEAPGRGASRAANAAAFRTFSTSNSVPMRDGQSSQFAVATDKITGETLKVDVTVNVVK